MADSQRPRWYTRLNPWSQQARPVVPMEQTPLTQEISSNLQRWGLWGSLAPRPLVNPDELVGRKGLRVFQDMRRDDQVKAVLALRKHAVMSTGWDVLPAEQNAQGGSGPDPEEVAEFCKHCLEEELEGGSFEESLKGMLTALDFGYSVAELVYKPLTSGRWRGKIALGKLASRDPVSITFEVDAHDNLTDHGVTQFGRKFPLERFAIFSYAKEFGNHYGQSELRAAYAWWWMKDNVMRWWAIFLDRYSIPIAVGKLPQTGTAGDQAVADFRTLLTNLQANTSITLPAGYDIAFPTAGNAQGSQIFDMAISKCDRGIAKAVLVPNLLGVSEQGDVGSYSQARKQFDVFILVVEADQRMLAKQVLGEQVLKRLVDLNYHVEEYPRFTFLPFTETNKAELFQLFFQALSAQAATARPEDEAHIRTVTEFPEVPEDVLQAEADARKQAAADQAAAQAAMLGGGAPGGPGGDPGVGAGGTGVPGAEGQPGAAGDLEEGDLGASGDEDPLVQQIADALAAKGVKVYAFDESEHPRDEKGRFIETVSGELVDGSPFVFGHEDDPSIKIPEGPNPLAAVSFVYNQNTGELGVALGRAQHEQTLDRARVVGRELRDAFSHVTVSFLGSEDGQLVRIIPPITKSPLAERRAVRRTLRMLEMKGVNLKFGNVRVWWHLGANEDKELKFALPAPFATAPTVYAFDEAEHPRADDGKFTDGGDGPGSGIGERGAGRSKTGDGGGMGRALLRNTMDVVKSVTTPEQRKAAWVIKTTGGQWEFHGPDRYYWNGQADGAAHARSMGWEAWLQEKHPKLVGEEYAQAGIARADVADVLVRLRAEQPDMDDAELVDAAILELEGGGDGNTEDEEPDDAELDALIAEALGQGGDGGAGDEELTDDELDALIEEALAEEEPDAARAEIQQAHPDWTPEQVDAELAKVEGA